MKKFTLAIAMSILAVMGGNQVSAQIVTSDPLDFSKMTNYYLLYLDEETVSANIPVADIAADYRVDDVNHFWNLWEGTYNVNTAIGPNSNMIPGAFFDLTVSNKGWSGCGFVTNAPGKNLAKIDDTYYFHIAFKSQSTGSHLLGFACGDKGEEGKLCIGSSPYEDGGTYYDPIADFPRDGEWYSIDIPVSMIKRAGAVFRDGTSENTFFMLSGGKEGENICFDAVYFYQKKEDASSVGSVSTDNFQVMVGNSTISVLGSKGIELYDISGKLIKATENSVVGTEDLGSGLYIVKSNNVAKKVMIK